MTKYNDELLRQRIKHLVEQGGLHDPDANAFYRGQWGSLPKITFAVALGVVFGVGLTILTR